MHDTRTHGQPRPWSAIASRRGAVLILVVGTAITALALLFGPTPHAASGPASSLPEGAESTEVANLQKKLADNDLAPAVVVFDREGEPLTVQDRAWIGRRAPDLAEVGVGGGSGGRGPVVVSPEGTAALVSVPLRLGSEHLVDTVTRLRATAKQDLPEGLRAQVTGAPAYEVDLSAVFDGADSSLLFTTVLVVAILLLVTYRSPVLWLIPLLVVGIADQVSVRLLGVATEAFGFSVDEATAGITSVLVFGAGTNYALLIIARYREELRREQDRGIAMGSAMRQAGPAVVASSSTVILALLTLSLAQDPFTRGLGYSGALGIATAVVSALTLLPAALVLLGRGLFWPFIPRVGDPDPSRDGFWARVAHAVGVRPSGVLAVSLFVIVVLSLPLVGVRTGLGPADQFRERPEAVTGQEALAAAFPAGASEPTVVITPATTARETASAAARTNGVAAVRHGLRSDGMVELEVVLDAPRGSPTATATVERLRQQLPSQAMVGGPDAEDIDARAAAARDRLFIIPAVLIVVLSVLLVLLRSVVAAVVLVATVVATYAAAMGVGWWISRHLLGFPAFDLGVPLLSFLFLVALGVDYNIFLSTRAREEARHTSTPRAIATALAVTGGVITSAGVLLAAVFTVLGVLPVVTLTQIGVIVGFGVLLDTLLVRSLLVPALVTMLADRFWWPSNPRIIVGKR